MARVSFFPWPISWERGWRQAGKAVRSRCCASGRVCSSVPHYQSGRQRSCALQCHYSSTRAPGSRSLLTGCGAAGRPPSELGADWETDPPRAQGSGVPASLGGSEDSALQSLLRLLHPVNLYNVVAWTVVAL